MRHSKANTMLLCLVCGCLFFSAQLSGQTPAPTHGTITVTYQFGRAFTLSTVGCNTAGCGWNLTGTFDYIGGWLALCNPCGGPINVNGEVVGNDFFGGTANYVGTPVTYYANVQWGSLFAQGPSYFVITGPNIPYASHGVGTFSGPFSFVGALCGVAISPSSCDVNIPNMTGTGVVFVTIATNGIGQTYATQVMYVF